MTLNQQKAVLVTGATGYVGSRLVKRLLHSGYRVKAVVRSYEKFKNRFRDRTGQLDVVQADLLDPKAISKAAIGCGTAYYLVHSLLTGRNVFTTIEEKCAQHFVQAAQNAHLDRIIYLGGLGTDENKLSPHLGSRAKVQKILCQGTVPVTVLRAAMILGSGSASFEILRYLVERLPFIIAPKSATTKCQPICIRNVLGYLSGCLQNRETIGNVYDIGGPDIISYLDLLHLYAKIAGLGKRIILTSNLMNHQLTAYLLSLITPVPSALVKELVEGLKNEVVCTENRIQQLIPQDLMTCEMAIIRALEKIEQQIVDSSYLDAGIAIPPEWVNRGDAPYSKGPLLECAYQIQIKATATQVWGPIQQIGGKTGWYFAGNLWWLRGVMDKLVGGVGLQRGRRHPREIGVGDVIDWWRVLVAEPAARLLLLAEMKLPGEAILDFRIVAMDREHTELTMHARFLAKGLSGLSYWYSIYPLHDYVFKGMLTNIAKACRAEITFGPVKL